MARRRLTLALIIALVASMLSIPTSNGTVFGPVVDGNARFQVLSPTLIRLEYAENGVFEDRPTWNALNRGNMAVTPFTTVVEEGVRVIRTGRLTLRYQQGSGPFGDSNLTVDLATGPKRVTARPSWELAGYCGLSMVCEAEDMLLDGGADGMNNEDGFTGRGFVGGMTAKGARMDWTQRDLPAAGRYKVHLRYASAPTGGTPQTLVVSSGDQHEEIELPPTEDWGTWANASATLSLQEGENPLSIECALPDNCAVTIDNFAVTPESGEFPPDPNAEHASANLGGWRRSLDYVDSEKPLPVMMHEGLVSRDGWYLLNDSVTAIANADGTTTPREPARSYQDGYFFGYGHDYRQGLMDLRALTGPPVMLPRQAFGTWFSEFAAFSDDFYRKELLPRFRAERVPLDMLVVDTDFKSPNNWNGWNWNEKLFPDPRGFLEWAAEQGLRVALNIHPSINTDDPRYQEVKAEIGGELQPGDCGAGTGANCRVFDLSDPAQLRAYFKLHDQFEQLGRPILWWLDSCCDGTKFQADGVSPDSLFNAQYARRADAEGLRGYSWNRSAGGYTGYGYNQLYPAGPWAEHRYTVDTTMDTTSSWKTLAYASYYTVRRGNIGMPYESHDIGAHNYYTTPQNLLPQDLYARWVQLGTFQPILRLHSNHGKRLPWEYQEPAKSSATKFMQLRESLLPYTYSLARQSHETGLPMNRGMYLNYPEFPEAYSFDKQFLYGDDVLVAPVTTPGTGNVSTQVWIPPGTWVDYFTGKSVTGPAVTTVTNDLSTMPVFLRAGGILPTRTDYVDHQAQRPMDQITLDVATGGTGSFSLYEDEGEGHGYSEGKFARTPIGYAQPTRTLTIGPREGTFPGAVDNRTWTAKFRDVSQPTKVTVNGQKVSDWSYDAPTRTLTVSAKSRATEQVTIGY